MADESILIVEDEIKIAELLKDYLAKAGFRVSCLARGDQALERIRHTAPALILLDLMLPGLEIGADDYICKPFSPREVVARVKAVLRRARPDAARQRRVAGPIILDECARQVTVDGKALSLTPSEFGLLNVLIAFPGRVFSRSELLDKVQGYRFEGYDRTIDSHVKNLRRKIAEVRPGLEPIQTIYGVGYRFSLP
jgi:two-component system response regulator BaeR